MYHKVLLGFQVDHVDQVQMHGSSKAGTHGGIQIQRALISTRNALLASVYKHPGIYKRSANMNCTFYSIKSAIFS